MKRQWQTLNAKTKCPPFSMTGMNGKMSNTKSRKTLFDTQSVDVCDARFNNNNLLPNIASKYRRNNRSFAMQTQSKRDTKHIIAEVNGEFRSIEDMGNKPPIKGNINFKKQVERKSWATKDLSDAPNIYHYCDKMNEAVDKFKMPKVPFGGYTMDKALSRDNAMYNISECSNLKPGDENSFVELLLLKQSEENLPLTKPMSNFSFSPRNPHLRQISSVFQTRNPKLSLANMRETEKRKYSVLLNYASQSTFTNSEKGGTQSSVVRTKVGTEENFHRGSTQQESQTAIG